MNDRVRVTRPGRRIVITLAAVALVSACWLAWKNFVEPRFFPKRFGVVIEGALYRSGRIDPSLLPAVIARYGIDAVVSLTHAPDSDQEQQSERHLLADHGARLARYPLLGNGSGDPAHVVGALIEMHDALAHGIVRPASAPLPHLPELAHD